MRYWKPNGNMIKKERKGWTPSKVHNNMEPKLLLIHASFLGSCLGSLEWIPHELTN